MASSSVGVPDYVIFVSLTALSMGTGLYLSLRKGGRLKTQDEAFLGSRTIHAIPLALSMVASNVTAVGVIAFVAHYYLHGMHTLWSIVAFVPAGLVVTYLFLPVLYRLKVTSIFQYLRLRYGNVVGITASLIYFLLSQATGAAGMYSAAVAMSTIFAISQEASIIILGVAGTSYTALGGLRSVVWADTIQALIMASTPLIIICKIIYDSSRSQMPRRPLTELNIAPYLLRTDMDFTSDETIWAVSLASIPFQLMKFGLDQMITQRFLAARSLRDARGVAFFGFCLMTFFYTLYTLTGVAIVYWFSDCDPVLSGSIARYDQIVPYYINEKFGAIGGVRGLFLAGVVSASISTISSIVNSHAAVLYVDIVSPNLGVSERMSALVVVGLAAASGIIMTALGLSFPHIGSGARCLIALYAAASGPFAGIIILAFLFPWANAKGTAIAALGVCTIQVWQTVGRLASQLELKRMTYSVDSCPTNLTTFNGSTLEYRQSSQVLSLYRLSPYWCSLVSTCATVLLGLALSVVCAKPGDNLERAAELSSPPALKLWKQAGFLRHIKKNAEHGNPEDQLQLHDSPLEIQPLQNKDAPRFTSCET
ncbi:sodium-coupled monocarboxylate transporter 2-like [Haemaphysalis longicornis]